MQLQDWNQQDNGTFRRADGAVVTADSTNPQRPWTATGPGNRVLSVTILAQASARRWRTAQHAIQAVDQQFPTGFVVGELPRKLSVSALQRFRLLLAPTAPIS